MVSLSISKRFLLCCAILAGLLTSAVAGAQAPTDAELPAKHRVVYDNLLVARLNPLGLEDQISLGYRYRLYRNPGLLWRDAYAGVAFTPTLNPAVARVGGSVEIKPLAVLLLSVGYYFVGWFGTFEYLQSYTSPHDPHSDTDQDHGVDLGRRYRTIGSELQLRVQALGKVGPIVLRNDLNFFRSDLDLRDGDRLSYNARIDAMVPDGGWALTNDTDLVYLSRFGLLAGIRTSIVHAFYRDGDFVSGESTDNPNTPTVRLGPLLAYTFYDRPGKWFNKPTALLIVNWWVKHRYRTGADVHQAIPYLVLGFKCEGDIWQR